MSKFGVQLSTLTTTTSVVTGIMLWGLTNRRAEIIEMVVTGAGLSAVADTPHQASGAYASTTLVGVGTTTTPEKFAQGSAVANSCTTTNFTQEPTTYGAVFPVMWGFNTRGGNKFSVPQGEGVKVDSGATQNRFGLRARGQQAGSVDMEMQFVED